MAGQTISGFGTQISYFVLPAVAVAQLHATPQQMGLLGTVELLPVLLGAALVGVWVDRVDRRRLMIAVDGFRALLMGCVAWLAAAGRLSMPALYLVALLSGAASIVFDIARQAFVPTVVPQEALPDANGKFELSDAVTKLAGPALGGAVLQAASGAAAVALDSVSYLASLVTLLWLPSPTPESRPERPGSGPAYLWASLREGWTFLWNRKALARAAVSSALSNFFASMGEAVWMIYVIRELHGTAAVAGTIQSLGHVGGIAGAAVAGWIGGRMAAGGSMLLGSVLAALGWWSTAAAQWHVAGTLLLALGGFLNAFGVTVFNVSQSSLRQRVTPAGMLGRVGATVRWLSRGVMPLGALAGGLVAGVAGVSATLLLAAGGRTSAAAWLIGVVEDGGLDAGGGTRAAIEYLAKKACRVFDPGMVRYPRRERDQ